MTKNECIQSLGEEFNLLNAFCIKSRNEFIVESLHSSQERHFFKKKIKLLLHFLDFQKPSQFPGMTLPWIILIEAPSHLQFLELWSGLREKGLLHEDRHLVTSDCGSFALLFRKTHICWGHAEARLQGSSWSISVPSIPFEKEQYGRYHVTSSLRSPPYVALRQQHSSEGQSCYEN